MRPHNRSLVAGILILFGSLILPDLIPAQTPFGQTPFDQPAFGQPPANQPSANRPPAGQPAFSQGPMVIGVIPSAAMETWGVGVIEIPMNHQVINQTVPPLAVEVIGNPVAGGQRDEPTPLSSKVLFPVAEEIRLQVRPPSQQPVPRPGGGRLLGRLKELIDEIGDPAAPPPQQTIARRVTFLFPHNLPMTVRVSDSNGMIGDFQIQPQVDAAAHAERLAGWWSGFAGGAGDQVARGDYPARVETYLVAMLAGRLNLPLPDWYLPDVNRPITGDDDPIWGTLALIGGAEKISDQMFRRVASGAGLDNASPSLPLPAPPSWAPEPVLPLPAELEIEPLASFVPPECFYLRFGSFENYLWFKRLTERNGGDIARMVTIRGIADNAGRRLERQLNLQTTAISKALGPTVIEDQAVIGTDMYMADGASVGTVIQAKQPFLLRTSLAGDRKRKAKDDPTVTLVERAKGFGDAAVSFLSSGDGRVRSFMTESDGVFLITNSRHLMTRFLAVRKSGQSMAKTPYFAAARTSIPVSRKDSLFAYFSPDMIRGLLSPKSMIELRRRLITESETALVPLARMAARLETSSPTGDGGSLDLDSLVNGGYLPTTFGNRPDGSGLIDLGPAPESRNAFSGKAEPRAAESEKTVFGEFAVVDTLRGVSGTYLPIADVEIDAVTPTESAWYRSIADAYSKRFATIDPIAIGVARVTPDVGVTSADGSAVAGEPIERLSIHAEIAPFRAANYGKYAQYLGPPTTTAIRFAPDDMVALQAHVASPQLGPPTHLFAGVKDTTPPNPEQFKGILNLFKSVRGIPGYIGAWPQPGMLDRLPLGLGRGTPVGPGMSRLIGGIYRYSDGQFSLLGFDPLIIEQSVATLEAVPVSDLAQVRGRVGDLKGSRLEPWIIVRAYEETAPKSLAGASFLSLLMRQFDLSANQTIKMAAQILGGTVQCPLGGEYKFDDHSGRWYSTAWTGNQGQPTGHPPTEPPALPPPGYQPPPLKWFAGAEFSLIQETNRLAIEADVTLRQ